MFIAFNRRNLYRTYNDTACTSFWYWFLLVVWDLSNTLLAFIWECKLVFLVWRQLVTVHKEQQFGMKGHWLVAGQNFLPLSMIPSFFSLTCYKLLLIDTFLPTVSWSIVCKPVITWCYRSNQSLLTITSKVRK